MKRGPLLSIAWIMLLASALSCGTQTAGGQKTFTPVEISPTSTNKGIPTVNRPTEQSVSSPVGGFTGKNVFSNGITLPGQWKCSNGSLTAMDPFSTVPAGSSSTNSLHSDSVDGTGLSASTKPGDSFLLTYHMSGTLKENGTTAPLTEVVSETCNAVNMLSVTVAAGTFDVLHLTCKISLTISATINGTAGQPIVSNSTVQRWFAMGVGLVKSSDTSSAGMRTTELMSYSIP